MRRRMERKGDVKTRSESEEVVRKRKTTGRS